MARYKLIDSAIFKSHLRASALIVVVSAIDAITKSLHHAPTIDD